MIRDPIAMIRQRVKPTGAGIAYILEENYAPRHR